MSADRSRRRRLVALALACALLLSGCLEQIATARIASGAARNFLYYLAHDEQADAATYWAPDHVPPDAAAQVGQAAATLRLYAIDPTRSESQPAAGGATIVTLFGHAHRQNDPQPGPEQPLLRARLIEIGPGWRLTEFHLLCCNGA